jgi:uncharacterized membrane protein YhaH (DUF805 family)
MSEENSPYEAPESDVSVSSGSSVLNMKDIFLSFQGRIPRKVYWLYGVLGLMIGTMVAFGVVYLLSTILGEWILVLMFPIYIVVVWASLAVGVKRWHDRDKSGWWILIGLIPLIGAIWAIVECGFLKGTEGDNRFGPEPGNY